MRPRLRRYRIRTRQSGLSLVELMIALVVGLVLIGGLLQLFVSTRTTFAVQEGMARLQENGRFALALLASDLREAGYRGCTSVGPMTNTLKEATTLPYNFGVGVEGFDAPPADVPEAAAGSDVLVVRHMDGDPVRVVDNNSGAQLFAEVTGVQSGACPDDSDRISGFCGGDILIISDCSKSRVFQATGLSLAGSAPDQTLNLQHAAGANPGNASTSWGGQGKPASEQFGDDSELMKINTYILYIAPGAGPDSPPALFRKTGAVAEELIDNIENMQILYGINSDSDPAQAVDDYVTASAIAADPALDWDQVVSIRLSLLVRSPEDHLTREPQTYYFDGAQHTASDRRLRQEFATTITLRNRAK